MFNNKSARLKFTWSRSDGSIIIGTETWRWFQSNRSTDTLLHQQKFTWFIKSLRKVCVHSSKTPQTSWDKASEQTPHSPPCPRREARRRHAAALQFRVTICRQRHRLLTSRFNTLILTITTVMWARTWLMLTLAPDRHFTSTPYVHTTWNSAMWHMSFPPQQPGPRGTCQSRPTWNKCSHHWHGTIKKDVSESLSKWLRCSRNRWFRFISRHFLLHSGVVLNYQTILVGIKGPLRTLDWFQFVLKWPDSIKAPFRFWTGLRQQDSVGPHELSFSPVLIGTAFSSKHRLSKDLWTETTTPSLSRITDGLGLNGSGLCSRLIVHC